jgi:hypothetical protein
MAEAAAGGLVASMVMSGMRQLTTGLGLVRQTPPEAVLKQGAPSVLAKFSRQRRRALIELAHWLYGTAGGLAYTLIPRGLRRHPLTGPTYGLILWLVFDKGVAPLLQLPHVERPSTVERLALLADHLVYGGIVSAALERSVPEQDPPRTDVPAARFGADLVHGAAG